MAETVAELLSRLRFAGGPVETLYLNQTRVHESFLGQLGAIESFTRTATKEGSIEAPVIKLGAGVASEAGVTWTLTDPTAQALVLRSSLESQGVLHSLDEAGSGHYISFAGAGFMSRPGMLEDDHRARLDERRGLYDALEAERGTQESILRMMEGQDSTMWLLTVADSVSICAAVLDNRWLNPGIPSWVGADYRWEIFARFRHRHETGVPLLAALHVTVKWLTLFTFPFSSDRTVQPRVQADAEVAGAVAGR